MGDQSDRVRPFREVAQEFVGEPHADALVDQLVASTPTVMGILDFLQKLTERVNEGGQAEGSGVMTRIQGLESELMEVRRDLSNLRESIAVVEEPPQRSNPPRLVPPGGNRRY